MAVMQVPVQDGPHLIADHPGHRPVTELHNADFESELSAMVESISRVLGGFPDDVMKTTMTYMARLTEMWLICVREEGRDRRKKFVKMQVQKVMDLMEFEYRASSRMLESMKMEADLTK